MRNARGFRPDPGTVLEAYEIELEDAPRAPALPEPEYEPISKEEALDLLRELKERLKYKEWLHKKAG